MATRNSDASAEKAYAAASAEVPISTSPNAAPSIPAAAAPQTATPAKSVAAPVAKSAKPVTSARKTITAKTATAKTAPVNTTTAKSVVAKAAKVAVAKPAAAKSTVTKAVAAKRITAKPTAVATARRTVKSTLAAVSSAAPTEAVLGFARKGQTMINETTTKMTAKMTEEATRIASEAKVRGEALVTDMQARAQTAASKGQEFAKDAAEFSRGNVEAIVESAKIVGTGMQAMGQEFATFAKASVEDTTAAAKRYAAIKTPAEFFALQTELTRSAIDAMVKNGSKTTEMTVKLANDAFQPISNRIALAVSKLKSAA